MGRGDGGVRARQPHDQVKPKQPQQLVPRSARERNRSVEQSGLQGCKASSCPFSASPTRCWRNAHPGGSGSAGSRRRRCEVPGDGCLAFPNLSCWKPHANLRTFPYFGFRKFSIESLDEPWISRWSLEVLHLREASSSAASRTALGQRGWCG